jgi:hypothetical protein
MIENPVMGNMNKWLVNDLYYRGITGQMPDC